MPLTIKHQIHYNCSPLTETEIYLFKEGSYAKMYEKFGAHAMEFKGEKGVHFTLWAPNATDVSVIADFNNYDATAHPLKKRDDESGVWEGFISHVIMGETYKYSIKTQEGNLLEKSDPFAFFSEVAPKSASITHKLDTYKWKDKQWIQKRGAKNAQNAPISVYEMHIGSWRRVPEEENRYLTYKELTDKLVEYLLFMNYTHVEFMPLSEYPYFGSWGYQVVGYFSATSRFGEPEDLMYLIDTLHQNGIGVILDWVPSHFAVDMHGLVRFDGTALYEHEDPRQGYHPEWGSIIFNYGRNEVRSFLISSAMFWMEMYHVDGLRVDAVASMLHLDYAREDGEWIPNKYGGNENLEAVEFLRRLNENLYREFPDCMVIAEESTAWPMVTRPTSIGGLGFGFKWNMGWMHDTLKYMSFDPIYRQHHHHQLTFSLWYAFDEHFMLPLSHDEVVHMKGSLINKMPGDEEKKFANLRAMYAYMMSHPGKKLLFMGGEIAQYSEWNYEGSLDWHMLENPYHAKLQKMLSDLNKIYKQEEALYTYDAEHEGFEWIDNGDYQSNTISFMRKSDEQTQNVYVLCNFSDATRSAYKIGVPYEGEYEEIFNSQSSYYNGSNIGNTGVLKTQKEPMHGREYSIELTLPPLGVIYLKRLSPKVMKIEAKKKSKAE
ncbi:MAG: 1,4-alpha-glucan branching protein GlgB [Campylobacterales bacterium]|nr:1,4-alpha-glucan branching protein GlgB [Campylobacterales bacterium]